MSGYVRIHRTLIGHPAFRNDAEAMAFAWLVAKAAWKPTRVRYKERAIQLGRGQLAISVRDFARAMDRDKAWIERLLKRLKGEAMVQTVRETGVTVVTICNYAEYQSDAVLCETVNETPQKTEARQGQDTEQEVEKGKKEKTPRKRALPVELPDWLPAEPWAAFVKMRKAMRVPFTEEAQRGIIEDLDKLRAEGHDPGKLLMKAVKQGWRGVFPSEDTKGFSGATSDWTPERKRQSAEKTAELMDLQGRTSEAAEYRKQWGLEVPTPPPQPIASIVREAASSMRVRA